MSPINLKRLVSQQEVLSLLKTLLSTIDTPIGIQSADGTLLIGDPLKQTSASQYPIQLEGEVLGWVVGESSATTIASLLTYLANQELEKKTLAKEVLDKYREIHLLYALSDKFTACLDLKEIAKLAIAETQKIVKATSISLMLLNSEQNLEVVSAMGEENHPKMTLKLGIGIAGNVLISETPEIINNVLKDPRFVPGDNPISSLICIPLKTQNGAIGVLNISSKEPANYTSQDLKFATGLASIASSAIENALLHENKLQEERIKSQLERYLPPQLVNAIIIAQDGDISLAPAKKNITILFSDIRSFTTKCEELPPERIVNYLNEYFTHMVDVIFQHEGTVNKFVGDMIVAMFGAPLTIPNHEQQAIAAAIEMQMCLKRIPNSWIRENFLTGIGISSGDVVIGNMGSPQHLDYTAIGDEVNLASRLQGLAQGGQILVSGSVYEATKSSFSFRAVGDVTVKGKRKSVDVFEVLY